MKENSNNSEVQKKEADVSKTKPETKHETKDNSASEKLSGFSFEKTALLKGVSFDKLK